MTSPKCSVSWCKAHAIVSMKMAPLCARHARPHFMKGPLQSLPYHDWKVEPDAEREGERWTCLRCGDTAGPKLTSQAAVRAAMKLARCAP